MGGGKAGRRAKRRKAVRLDGGGRGKREHWRSITHSASKRMGAPGGNRQQTKRCDEGVMPSTRFPLLASKVHINAKVLTHGTSEPQALSSPCV